MAIDIREFSAEDVKAARAFNQRMRAAKAATDFLLPEDAPVLEDARMRHYIIRDGEFARGGFLRLDQRGWLNGAECRAVNYQSPLSEGIANKRFGMVAGMMLRFMETQGDCQFMVGMGGEDKPLPKLLKAAGWLARPAPFLFKVHRAGRFLTELRMLHRTPARSLAVKAAAWSRAGRGGRNVIAAAGMGGGGDADGFTIEMVTEWGGWADAIWDRFRACCSFAVCRDRRALEAMYDLRRDPRLLVALVRKSGEPVGWTVSYLTAMRDSEYFGNLKVGAILDGAAAPGDMRATVELTDVSLASRGADLTITNQTHRAWVAAYRRCWICGRTIQLRRRCVEEVSEGGERGAGWGGADAHHAWRRGRADSSVAPLPPSNPV